MKKVLILGATGSLGKKALHYVTNNLDKFTLVGATAHTNIINLASLPKTIVFDTHSRTIADILDKTNPDIVLHCISGFAGLNYSIEIIKRGITLGLANKESIVCGGPLLMKLAEEHKCTIIPIDSEHNSIFQLLQNKDLNDVKQITITASGGPFWQRSTLRNITKEEALKHPNWNMGNKITIDSATMINKLLELFEALFLFGIKKEKLNYVIEPTSSIHACITLHDGTIFPLISTTSMIMPISHAMHYPERARKPSIKEIDLTELSIKIHPVNKELFTIFKRFDKMREPFHQSGIIINAANEIAVAAFLEDKLPFEDIYGVIEHCLDTSKIEPIETFEHIKTVDTKVRKEAEKYINTL